MSEMVTEADVIQPGVPPRMMDKYTLRFTKIEFGPSKSSGNPMVSFESEIIKPDKKTVDGKTYALDTLTVRQFFPITVLDPKTKQVDVEKTKKARGRYIKLRKVLGLNPSFNPEAPGEKDFEGIVYEQILDSTEEKHMRRKDDGSLEPIIDEATKQPLSRGWAIKTGDIIGRSSIETNKPY